MMLEAAMSALVSQQFTPPELQSEVAEIAEIVEFPE